MMSLVLQFATLLILFVLLRRFGDVVRRLGLIEDRLSDGGSLQPVPHRRVEGASSLRTPPAGGTVDADGETAPREIAGPLTRSPGATAAGGPSVAPKIAAFEAPAAAAEPAAPAETTAETPPPAPAFVAEAPGPAPAPPRRGIDLELRFGRRWAALLGGGAVAFGLALLVRHSIQQGFFPPSVRLAGAALLSLVLCLAAEAFRRRGTFASPMEAGIARRIADIPSILLGTGLAGLFAVAYAAQAVYGFLGAGTAFAVMAAAALAGLAATLVYGPARAILGYLAAEAVPFLIVGDGLVTGAAYVALVGIAGYAAAFRGGWRRLENPAGIILLLWALLLRTESFPVLACVALPASAAAIAVTVLRLRPRAAWRSRRQSLDACLALALASGHGLLLATHLSRTSQVLVFEPVATALGLAVLLAGLAIAATATRARPAAPLIAAVLVWAIAELGRLAALGGQGSRIVIGLAPVQVWTVFAILSVSVLAIGVAALHRASRRSSLTALVGTASAAAFLAAGDLVLHETGGIDRRLLALLALAQGLGLIVAARPLGGVIPPTRDFASAIAASVGIGLLGFAALSLGLGEGARATIVLALTAAGAAGLAVAWRTPLFASVAGIAAIPVILHAGLEAVRTFLAVRHAGEGAALLPILENTLAPGLVLAGTVALLHRRPGGMAVREADRRWFALFGAAEAGRGEGPPASLAVAAIAAGGLLLGALVATVRWIAFGNAYAPLSAPADIGLACAFSLSGAVAGLRLHRATPSPRLAQASDGLARLAVPLLAAALIANPFVTGTPVGAWPGLNLLVLAYLLPATLAWRLARDVAGSADGIVDGRLRGWAGGMTLAGLLAYTTGAVSQFFQGPVLTLAGIGEAELWTHTVAWLLIGAATLAYGIKAGARVARLAALGIVAAVTVKVIFVDVAHLTGVARALSVIVLGLVLLGIGMVYQRLAALEARVTS